MNQHPLHLPNNKKISTPRYKSSILINSIWNSISINTQSSSSPIHIYIHVCWFLHNTQKLFRWITSQGKKNHRQIIDWCQLYYIFFHIFFFILVYCLLLLVRYERNDILLAFGVIYLNLKQKELTCLCVMRLLVSAKSQKIILFLVEWIWA